MTQYIFRTEDALTTETVNVWTPVSDWIYELAIIYSKMTSGLMVISVFQDYALRASVGMVENSSKIWVSERAEECYSCPSGSVFWPFERCQASESKQTVCHHITGLQETRITLYVDTRLFIFYLYLDSSLNRNGNAVYLCNLCNKGLYLLFFFSLYCFSVSWWKCYAMILCCWWISRERPSFNSSVVK